MRRVANKKKSILIVSMRKKAAIFVEKTLQDVFEDSIDVSSYSFSEKNKKNLSRTPTLVLASGEYSYNNALSIFPSDKIILAKRDISVPIFFDKIFLLPQDKKVLVINETKEGTLETIKALQQMGITHLQYIPYWQDCGFEPQDTDTAISPGMLHICPKNITTEIDIGMRQISISTFIRILNYLDLDFSYAEKFVYNHKKLLIDTYRQVSEQYSRAEGLRKSLESILNNINEAIIAVKDNNIISEFNPAAEQLFGFARKEMIGKNIQRIIGNLNLTMVINSSSEEKNNDNILLFNNKKIFVTYIPLNADSTDTGIYTFKEIIEIQKMEESLRKILYKKNSGYAAKYTFRDILAESEQMKSLIINARDMACTDSTILISGESGTGKELFAQAIHNSSPRKSHPFIAVNFAAIPDNLVESELFGYEEGAFTGAKRTGKKGLFELAHNGTIFLDEIGDSSLWIQSRLLRVLEEKEIMRLGDTRIIPVDVRVIVATNKNLKELIKKGLFREDLYYRLNVFPLYIPPLRERKESIVSLIKHLMSKQNLNRAFSEEAYNCLINYNWPGNIRELKNMVEYISISAAKKESIQLDDLPYDIKTSSSQNLANNSDNIDLIIEELKASLNTQLVKHILQIIQNNKYGQRIIGRNKIAEILTNQGYQLTDAKTRTILYLLASHGLVSKGTTKQGTTITKLGEIVLNTLSQGYANNKKC